VTPLPDVNVLLALTWPNHQFHAPARAWFRRLGRARWCTCAITQLGFIRLSSNPAFTPFAKTPLEATLLLRQLTARPGHRFVADLPAATTPAFASVAERLHGHQQTTDAYLVHLGAEHGMTLVTFDHRIALYAPAAAVLVLAP
jgi:hypothetical protein